MAGDELPPLNTRLTADIQGLADGLVKGKALVQAFKAEVAAEFGGGIPVGERLGSDIGDGIGRGIQDSAPLIQDQVKDKIKDPVTKAGKETGLAFSTEFRDSIGQSLAASPVFSDSLVRDATDKGRGAGTGFSVSFGDSVKANLTESTVASILDPSGPVGTKLKDDGDKIGGDAGKSTGGSFLANASPLLIGAFAAAATAGPAVILGGAATAVLGVEALVTHSNANLAGSYQQLGQHASAAIDKATEPLIPQMQASLNVLDQGIGKIGPQLKDTFAAVAPDATQITDGLVSLVSNTLPGMNQGLKDIQPEVHVISEDFGKLGDAAGGFFAGLGQGAGGGTQGFDAIITAVEHLLPDLGRVIGDLSNGLGPALHDVETVAVPVANALADVADALPPGAVRGTADAVALLYGAFKIGSLTSAVAEGTTFTQWLGITKTEAKAAAVEIEAVGVAEEGAAAKTGLLAGLGSASGKAIGGLGAAASIATGPLGLLVAGSGLLGDELGKLAGVGEHVTVDMGAFAGELSQAASGSYAAQQQVNVLASSVDFMQGAIGMGAGAISQMDATLVQLQQTNPAQAAQDFQALSDAFSKDGKSASDVASMLPGYTRAVKDSALASQQMGTAQAQALGPAQAFTQAIVAQQQKLAQQSQNAGIAAVTLLDLGVAQTGLEQSLAGSVNSYQSATGAANAYDQVLTSLNGAENTLLTATANYTIALDGVSKAAQANGHSLDQNNAKGAQNIITFSGLAKSAQSAAVAVYENEVSTKGANKAFDDANAKLLAEKNAFVAAADKAGFNKQQVAALADELFKLPKEVPIDVNVTSAVQHAEGLVQWIDSLTGTITVQAGSGINTSGVSYNPKSGGGKAYYAGGGWTKAQPGYTEEAVLHPREYVLSEDMLAGHQAVDPQVLAAMRSAMAGVGVGGSTGAPGPGGIGGGSGDITVITPVYLDGRLIGRSVTKGSRASAQDFARHNAITGFAGNFN